MPRQVALVALLALALCPSRGAAQPATTFVSTGDVRVPRAGGRVVDGYTSSVELAFSGSPETVAQSYRQALTDAGCTSPVEPTVDGTLIAFSCVQADGHWLSVTVSGSPLAASVNVSAARFGPFWFRLDGDRSGTFLGPETFMIRSAEAPEPMLARYRAGLEAAGCRTAARSDWPTDEGVRWVCTHHGTTYALHVIPLGTGGMATLCALDPALLRFPAEGALTVAWSERQLDVTYPPSSTFDAVARYRRLLGSCEEREIEWDGRELECRRGGARYLLSVGHTAALFFVRVERESTD